MQINFPPTGREAHNRNQFREQLKILPRGDDTSVCGACKKYRHGKDIIWVPCDNCETWYHFSCVREESANNLKGWACPPCEKGDTDIVKTNTTAHQGSAAQGLQKEPKMSLQETPGINTSTNVLMLQMLEEKREAEQRYIEQKNNILSRQHDPNMTWTPTTMGPSSVHLSARQILPADLPTFNGNPDEWPTFISAFENSTSAAGFSNVENMLRLQKCL